MKIVVRIAEALPLVAQSAVGSADILSAVSRISNPQACKTGLAFGDYDGAA